MGSPRLLVSPMTNPGLTLNPISVVSWALQALVEQGSPLKQFALPIVCDIAKASKRAFSSKTRKQYPKRVNLPTVCVVFLLLQALIEQGSPLKQFALPIFCDIA